MGGGIGRDREEERNSFKMTHYSPDLLASYDPRCFGLLGGDVVVGAADSERRLRTGRERCSYGSHGYISSS